MGSVPMSAIPNRQSRRGAFTMVEMLITIALIAVLFSLALTIMQGARARSRALRCLANQQQISAALVSFYQDHLAFPSDDPSADLADALSSYIPWSSSSRTYGVPDVYRCPNDRAVKGANSYQDYYVRRREPTSSEYFVLGCPRHTDVEDSNINVHGLSQTITGDSGAITVNGAPVAAEADATQRSMNSGTMTFDDGSKAVAHPSLPNYRVTAVASFKQERSTLYTIVRVTGRGSSTFTVTPGSRFEVVTPIAIIGVKGTQFTIRTEGLHGYVYVTHGVVEVWDRITNEVYELHAGESADLGAPYLERLAIEPFSVNKWKVKNYNPFDVLVHWCVVREPDVEGAFSIGYNEHVVFSTGVDPMEDVRITYKLPKVGSLNETGTRLP